MRIMVTGAAGFIGRHLCRELADAGYTVVAVDRADGDLREDCVFASLIEDYQPQQVVHLAARVGRLNGEIVPAETIRDNATMTTLVAKVCGERGIPLAYASTSEVYGDGAETTWEETDITAAELPHNLYGLTKRWGEEVCRLYAPECLNLLRFSMPYGPGHPPGTGRAALTNFLDCALYRRPITVHAHSERAWCWIGDTVRGVRMILESGAAGAWNVGRDDNAMTMRQVAEMACDLVDAPRDLIEEVDPPDRQTVVKRLSTEKLAALGWKPEIDLVVGMRLTLDWLISREEEAA
jgi:nucleoside-diphosphate-sugar epimerase